MTSFHLNQYAPAVAARLAELNQHDFTTRFWQRDATLWTPDDAEAQQSIRSFMGWLDSPEILRAAVPEIEDFVEEVQTAGFEHLVVMGMGGSTMGPIVFQRAFERGARGLPLSILDTTDPGAVAALENSLPLAETLFIVASKSGTTAEPLAFGDYFYARLKEIKGERAGDNFVAITDPGSKFAAQAAREGYRRTFVNFADVGGRFSVLTYFGMVPAALYGLNISALLDGARAMRLACGAAGAVPDNPGLALGVALGVLAKAGRDKLTLITPPALSSLGLWLEQLLAESTGKQGKGILPVAGEPLGAPEDYGTDRVFVYVGYEATPDEANHARLRALEATGHPVILLSLPDNVALGAEFYRWEIAVAVVGIVLGINPFDQPNVQESKLATDRVMQVVTEQGHLPDPGPAAAEASGVSYYADQTGANAQAVLKAFFAQARPGDFLNLQAYLHESDQLNEQIAEFRQRVQHGLRIATTSGYGPRFLHSTGQYHKGGPNTGLFVQLTANHPRDLPLPGRTYTFGTFENAQAQGDLETLRHYGRRTLHLHLGANAETGLASVLRELAGALAHLS